ncbi:FecCD family ABC transporter permease [Kiloniella litopenaei]|uniref:FecCD family ABC transporter permease n=1 Tax=Kiloniella litopenaei TaxID=1549748 RepID=UPI003BACAB23
MSFASAFKVKNAPLGQVYKINRFYTCIIVCLSLIIIACLLGIFIGSSDIEPSRIIAALTGEGGKFETIVVWQLRIPRFLVGLTGGIALALSGLIMQSILRNPLASPELTGVSMGTAIFVVASIVFFPSVSALWHPAIGLIGGFIAGGFVLTVSLSRSDGTLGLILGGVAISAFCAAGVMIILKGFAPFAQPAYIWLIGAIAGRGMMHLYVMLPWVSLGLIVLFIARRPMYLLSLGDDTAQSMGLNVVFWRSALLFAALSMTAGVVSIAGPIAFIGLSAPHIARLIIKKSENLIVSTALIGACLMVFSDWVARIIASPREIPVGLFLALIGAPLFIHLIRSSNLLSQEKRGRIE